MTLVIGTNLVKLLDLIGFERRFFFIIYSGVSQSVLSNVFRSMAHFSKFTTCLEMEIASLMLWFSQNTSQLTVLNIYGPKNVQGNKEEEAIYEIIEGIGGGTKSFEKWLKGLSCCGTWAGSVAAVFICLITHVNIVVITNVLNGFEIVDIRELISLKGENFINDSAPCVYLYHHLHKCPFEKSQYFNHFPYIQLSRNTKVKEEQV